MKLVAEQINLAHVSQVCRQMAMGLPLLPSRMF